MSCPLSWPVRVAAVQLSVGDRLMSIATVISLFINGRGTIRGLDGACLPGNGFASLVSPQRRCETFIPWRRPPHSDDVE